MRALLASLRIANAPSVISNVWLGYMLGWHFSGLPDDPTRDLTRLIAIGLCLYFAGNLLNDWHDRDWDKKHRPERALPSEKFSPSSYLAGAIFLTLNALISAATISHLTLQIAGGILILIILYTALHKRTVWAVIPMGLCRAGLYMLGFHTILNEVHGTTFILVHALGLFSYIVGLSLTARYESIDTPPRSLLILSRLMLFAPVVAITAWWLPSSPLGCLAGILPFAAWLTRCLTRYRKPVPVLVSALLAGIPLIDSIAATLIVFVAIGGGHWVPSPLAFTALAISLSAFLLGRFLQRIAPAT